MSKETVKDHCKHPDCKYRTLAGAQPVCDYLLATQQPRGCKISECDKYVSANDEKKHAVTDYDSFEESFDECFDAARFIDLRKTEPEY